MLTTLFSLLQVQTTCGVPAQIGEIIKGKYPGAWPAWGDVPIEQRDFWFNEFKVSDFSFIKYVAYVEP